VTAAQETSATAVTLDKAAREEGSAMTDSMLLIGVGILTLIMVLIVM
jgi:hypothetical protein